MDRTRFWRKYWPTLMKPDGWYELISAMFQVAEHWLMKWLLDGWIILMKMNFCRFFWQPLTMMQLLIVHSNSTALEILLDYGLQVVVVKMDDQACRQPSSFLIDWNDNCCKMQWDHMDCNCLEMLWPKFEIIGLKFDWLCLRLVCWIAIFINNFTNTYNSTIFSSVSVSFDPKAVFVLWSCGGGSQVGVLGMLSDLNRVFQDRTRQIAKLLSGQLDYKGLI